MGIRGGSDKTVLCDAHPAVYIVILSFQIMAQGIVCVKKRSIFVIMCMKVCVSVRVCVCVCFCVCACVRVCLRR